MVDKDQNQEVVERGEGGIVCSHSFLIPFQGLGVLTRGREKWVNSLMIQLIGRLFALNWSTESKWKRSLKR